MSERIERKDLISDEALQAIVELVNKLEIAQTNLKELINQARALNKQMTAATGIKEMNKQTVEAAKLQNKLNIESAKYANDMKKLEVAAQRTALQAEKASIAQKKHNDSLTKAKENTNAWEKALDSFQFKFNALGNIAANALSKITSKIVSTVKEFISLEKIMRSTQGTADYLDRAIASLKGSFDYLAKAISTGNLTNFFSNLAAATKAAYEYSAALDDIGDSTLSLGMQTADVDNKVAELRNKILKKSEYTTTQLLGFAEEALKLETELAEKKRTLAQKDLDALVQANIDAYNLLEEEQIGYLKNYIDNAEWNELVSKRLDREKIVREERKLGVMTNVRKGYEDLFAEFDKNPKLQQYYDLSVKMMILNDKERGVLAEKYKNVKNVNVEYYNSIRRITQAYERLVAEINNTEEAADKAEKSVKTITNKFEGLMKKTEENQLSKTEKTYFWPGVGFVSEDAWNAMMDRSENSVKEATKKAAGLDNEAERNSEKVIEQLNEIANKRIEYELYAEDALNVLKDKRFDKEMTAAELKYQQEVAYAEKTIKNEEELNEKKLKLAEEYENKQKSIRKKYAIIQAAIDIAVVWAKFAAAKATAISGATAASFLNPAAAPAIATALAAALANMAKQAGIQTASIAVQAGLIAGFAKGTESSPEGLAWVGEKGRELMIDKRGNVGFSPDKAALTYLEKGTKIIPADITARMMMDSKRRPQEREQNEMIPYLAKIADKPVTSVNIDNTGISVMTETSNTLTRRIDKYFRS